MKKNIVFALLCAATMLGLSACNKNEEFESENGRIHSATFKVQLADDADDADTKTALMFKMVPDWRNTDVEDIHIFETETTSGGSYFMEASKVEMTTPVDGSYEKALFYAEFDNATVIVTPPETKAGGSVFSYTAILGQRVGDTYTLPAVQYPHAESNIDPKADFLVGRVVAERTQTLHEQTFDINFHRPVALSRLFITNLEGSKVLSVKLTSLDDLTGSLKYEDIDFTVSDLNQIAQAVDFKHNDNSNVLTLLYPGGRTRTSVFQPFFVTVAGSKRITEVEVRTDKYIYTKSYGANGATITFYASKFNNIAMDMSVKEGGNVTRTENNSQDIKFLLGDTEVTEENGIVYDLAEHNGSVADFVAPTLTGAVGDVTYSSSDTDIATVSAEGAVTLTGELGDVVISAEAAGDSQYSPASASYKITVKDLRAEQNPTFSSDEAEYDLTTMSWTKAVPALQNAHGTVKYESSDTDVVTVDADSGAVTVASTASEGDTAVITANADGNATYKPGSASYSVSIVRSGPVQPTGSTYTLIEGDANLATGTYVIANKTNEYLLNASDPNSGGYSTIGTTSGVTLSGSTITLASDIAEAHEFVITRTNDNLTIKKVGGDHAGQYLFASSSVANSYMGFQSSAATFTINKQTNTNLIYFRTTKGSSENEYLYKKAADSYFKLGKSGAPDGEDAGVLLYKKNEGGTTPKKTQSIAFDGDTAVWDIAGSGAWEQSVPNLDRSGAETTVIFTSSNTAVAEVNTTSGEVTIPSTARPGDTATITATAEETDEYEEATASYVIEIIDSTPVAQILTFNPASLTGQVGATVTPPTVSGAKTSPLSWTSSNEAVATVDKNTGVMSLSMEGSTTITVTAPVGTVDGVNYAEGSGSFVLTVSAADPTPTGAKTYTQIGGAAELVTGTYLIVEKTHTFVFNASGTNHGGYGTIGTTEGISLSGTTITLTEAIASSYEFTLTRTGNNLTVQPVAGDNAGKYMYATNSVSSTYIDFQTSANNFTINPQSGDLVYVRTTKGTSENEYLYKKSSDDFFKLGGSGAPGNGDAGLYLYKLNDGGTPPEPPTPSAPTYTLIEGDANLTSGTYVIADKTNAYLLNATNPNSGGYSTIGTTSGVTLSGSTITLASDIAEAHEFVFTRTNDNLTIKKVGGEHAGQYLFASSSVTNSYMGFQSSAATFTINKQTDTNLIYFRTTKGSSENEYLYKKAADSYFKLGKSGAPGGEDAGVLLYKKN